MKDPAQEGTGVTLDLITIDCLKAIDNKAACEKFSQGHLDVLKDIGVKQVTSANLAWHNNPNSYIIPVSISDSLDYVAGARVDVYGGTGNLPIEDAIGMVDKSIYALIGSYAQKGTGEVCGLWTSRRTTGNGIAFMLIKAAVATANLLGLESLFALCSPFTVSMFSKVGFEVLKSVGNEGTFYYPKLDLIATAMILKDVKNLSMGSSENTEAIFKLIKQPNQIITENGSKNKIKVQYNLDCNTSLIYSYF